jgi:hypothetical protein
VAAVSRPAPLALSLAALVAVALALAFATEDGTAPLATPAIVYLVDDELWAASLDGAALPPHPVGAAGKGLTYRAAVRRPGGAVDLYYTVQLSEPELTDEGPLQQFGLFRVPLAGGAPQEVLRFAGPMFIGSATPSPDGRYVALTEAAGLTLLDLVSGERTHLADHTRVIASDGTVLLNHVITDALWSPDGRTFRASKYIGNDSTVNMLIDPFADPPSVIEIGYEGFFGASWSPDGQKLCLWSAFGLYEGGLVIYDTATGQATDLWLAGVLPTPEATPEWSVDGCAWDADGRLAAGYSPGRFDAARIFVFDRDLNLIAQSEASDVHSGVAAWLPDGAGVIVNRRMVEAESGQWRSLPPAVFRPETGAFEELPFGAATVVAVIP